MKFFLLLGLIFFATSASFSSERKGISTVEFFHEQEFRFTPGRQDNRTEITNFLLQAISEGNNRLRVFTSYTFSCQIRLEYSFANGNYDLSVEVINPQLKGDVFYREFDISDILVPDMLDLRVDLKSEKQVLVRRIQIDAIEWTRYTDQKFIHKGTLPSNNRTLTPYLTFAGFYYHSGSLSRFRNWSEALSSYYNAQEKLDQSFRLIEGLDSSGPETIILDEFNLCEAEVLYGEVLFAPFHKQIDIDRFDPVGVKESMTELGHRLPALRNRFNFIISHIDSLLFVMAESELQEGKLSRATELYERTLLYNPMHVPANLALARLELIGGKPQNAMSRLEKFMGRVGPAGIWLEMAREFSESMFNQQISESLKTMDDGRYLDALRQLHVLEGFCQKSEQWVCPETLFKTLQRAHMGMYRSYLSVAQRAYQSSNYSFAESYAENAGIYQKENQQYITDDKDVMNLLNLVYNDYLKNAENAQSRNDFVAASNYVDRAMALCSRFQGLVCHENLADLRDQIRNRGDISQRMVVEYVIQQPELVKVGLDPKAAREAVLDYLSQGHLNSWAGRTREARQNLNLVMEYALLYDLRKDTLINMRIISLGDMIKKKECELNERDIRTLLSSVKSFMERRFYTQALRDYQMVTEMQKTAVDCNWNYETELAELSYVITAAQYQDLLNEAQSLYFRAAMNGYDDFLAKYKSAEDFYIQNFLDRCGVRHDKLTFFIEKSSNTQLAKAAVIFFADNDLHDKTLLMLEVLRTSGADANNLRSLQEYTGEKAAIYLYSRQPDLQPREYVRQITSNDNWYKYYVGSFVKNWPR